MRFEGERAPWPLMDAERIEIFGSNQLTRSDPNGFNMPANMMTFLIFFRSLAGN
jgi:hypothetical protein